LVKTHRVDTVKMREIEMQEKIRLKEIEEKWEIEEVQIQEKRKAEEMQMQLRMKECEIQQCRLSKEKDERVPLALSSLQNIFEVVKYIRLVSELTWFIRYIYYWNLQFLNIVIIIKTKVLLRKI
jgi:hypothetical protein